MGVGMEADFLSQSKREARARRDFPTLEPAEGGRCFIFIPKDPAIDPVISQQRTQQLVEGALST